MKMFDFTDFCRICTRAKCHLTDIFSMDDDKIKFSEKLRYCVTEIMTEEDVLPNYICENCCRNLKISYSFKKMCLKTRSVLCGFFFSRSSGIVASDESECVLKLSVKEETVEDEILWEENGKEEAEIKRNLEEVKTEEVGGNFLENSTPTHANIKEECISEGPAFKTCAKCDDKIAPTQNYNTSSNCSYQCLICEAKFEDKEGLNVHESSHADATSFLCSICDYRFTKNSHLQAHMRVHTGQKPYRCDLCDESFAWKHHLGRHMKLHSRGNLHYCAVCPKSFEEVIDYQNHLKNHETQTQRSDSQSSNGSSDAPRTRWVCPRCNETFTDQRTMVRHHLTMHNPPRVYGPVTCPICAKHFKGRHKLAIHMRVHTGERPFSCPICQKSFTQSGYLSYHMRIHTGERPFRCQICAKTFTQKTTLGTHMRVHARKTPHSCPICFKTVSYDSTLRRHIKMMHAWALSDFSHHHLVA